MRANELTETIIGAAIEVHKALGPGLLESAYEECLAHELNLREIIFERQRALPAVYKVSTLTVAIGWIFWSSSLSWWS